MMGDVDDIFDYLSKKIAKKGGNILRT